MIDVFQVNPGLWLILAGLICALVPKGDAFAMVRKALVIGAPILASPHCVLIISQWFGVISSALLAF